MSTESVLHPSLSPNSPALTDLGRRVEILRIGRGMSKQALAHHAGTSRQQLWRVMTGKCELTTGLRERLASALSVQPPDLEGCAPGIGYTPPNAIPYTAVTVFDYLSNASHLALTLQTLPSGEGGRRLKRALLNAVDDLSVDAGRTLSTEYVGIRHRVLAGEL